MNDPVSSILDLPAISGCYFFPQPRTVVDPLIVQFDGIQLACYRRVVDPECHTLIYFHGNGEAVADYLPDMADEFAERGLNSLFVEYREYGGSTGKAQLVSMLGDGEAIMREAGIASQQVIAFGRSIGSLYAIELAYRQPNIAGLILESGIADPAERFLTRALLTAAGIDEHQVAVEIKKYFDNRQKLAAFSGPLLIMHTENDHLIDISHAERNLHWSNSSQKRLIRYPVGDHNSIMAWNRTEYFEALADFVKGLRTG